MKMKKRKTLKLESLERRITMAGDVSAALSGQDLIIAGDALDNEIRVVQNAAGNVTVAGVNGTTINGRPSVVFTNPNLIKAEIRMGDGNDVVTIRGTPGVTVSNDVNIELGAGNDTLRVSHTRVGASLAVKGEQGVDRVNASFLAVGHDINVDSGLDASNVSIADSSVGGAVKIVGEAAVDAVSLARLSIGAEASVETKGGNDRVTVANVVARSFSATTDEGADVVRLTDVSTLEDVDVSTGLGNDAVELTRVSAGQSVLVHTDGGNDKVTATDVAAAIDAIFTGGDGVDTLDNNGIIAGAILELKEFEIQL